MAKQNKTNTTGARKHHNEKRAPYQYGSKCMDIQMSRWTTTYVNPETHKKVTQVVSAMKYPFTPDSVARHNASVKKNAAAKK